LTILKDFFDFYTHKFSSTRFVVCKDFNIKRDAAGNDPYSNNVFVVTDPFKKDVNPAKTLKKNSKQSIIYKDAFAQASLDLRNKNFIY